MQRLIGSFWALMGFLTFGLSIVWLILEQRVLAALPFDPRQFFGNAPQYGDYLGSFIGFFLIMLGIRLVQDAPGTRIVAALVHTIVGLCCFLMAYLLYRAALPWPSQGLRYIVLGSIGVLAIAQLGIAWQFRQPRLNTDALQWKPFERCARCGRKLDDQGRCSVHDVPQVQARFVNEQISKAYAISLPESTLGTGEAVQVRFDLDEDPSYRHISQIHARLGYDAATDRFFIVDLDSTNGTFIAGQELLSRQPEPLPPGTTVKLGGAAFRFEVNKLTQDQLDS